jgi:hypothetical protein
LRLLFVAENKENAQRESRFRCRSRLTYLRAGEQLGGRCDAQLASVAPSSDLPS